MLGKLVLQTAVSHCPPFRFSRITLTPPFTVAKIITLHLYKDITLPFKEIIELGFEHAKIIIIHLHREPILSKKISIRRL
jgi:hypothetical protein